MEKVILPTQKLTPNFIGSWTMNPLSICDELIAYFELHKNKQKKTADFRRSKNVLFESYKINTICISKKQM